MLANLTHLSTATAYQQMETLFDTATKRPPLEIMFEQIKTHANYFAALAEITGYPVQDLRNLYLNSIYHRSRIYTHEGILLPDDFDVKEGPCIQAGDSCFAFIFITNEFTPAVHRISGRELEVPLYMMSALLIDERKCKVGYNICPDIFRNLTDNLRDAWGAILHDLVHGIMPHDYSEEDASPEYQEAIRMLPDPKTPTNSSMIASYEANVQGIHSCLFNHTKALAPVRERTIRQLGEILDQVDEMRVIAERKGYSEKTIAGFIAYFRDITHWILWHVYQEYTPQYTRLELAVERRAAYSTQAVLRETGERIFTAYEKNNVQIAAGSRPHHLAVEHLRNSPHEVRQVARAACSALLMGMAA